MMIQDIIGTIGAILTTACFIPQVVKIIRTKDTRSISLMMYVVFTLGVACWLTYGIILNALPVIIANAVTLVLTFIIIWQKVKHG